MKKIPLLLLLWLIPALACNYPGWSTGSGLSGEALRQTLAAQSPPPPGQTPLPPAAITPQLPLPQPETAQAPYPQATGSLYTYTTRPGDTLPALAGRFGVEPGQIIAQAGGSWGDYLPIGAELTIPAVLPEVLRGEALLPDAELVYSPTALGFDLEAFIRQAGGYLSDYTELVERETLTGAAIIRRVAQELSVNPRLLLGLLEFRAGWVYGQPPPGQDIHHPLGLYVSGRSGLYQEIQIAATQLNLAYYGWRQGTFSEVKFRRQVPARLDPSLNAGSVALQHLFALLYAQDSWSPALYEAGGFASLYQRMFGDPWARAEVLGPLLPEGLTQPALELPFLPGQRWSLTAGPHPAWNAGTPRAALDFSPVTGEAVCAVSRVWATAAAPGVVARAEHNALALDLDGDGSEATGWVLVYLHLAEQELIPAGKSVGLDEPLGHPSCEGGRATGKHVHLARKYNGEWLPADGPVPFVLSGWQAVAAQANYQGSLIKGEQAVYSNPGGNRTSIIVR
ncbi:MAG TPA: LysM domain-containing protein [Anaerolineales bacterium]|nr:LysM domain-containing protein [Anaerolineales bacterium]